MTCWQDKSIFTITQRFVLQMNHFAFHILVLLQMQEIYKPIHIPLHKKELSTFFCG